jgi:glycosyltransferase involved in cell wall biosynthesis
VFKKMVSKNLAQSDQAGLKDSSIRLVAPSKWLASKAERSQVFSNHSVSVIENPVAIDFFQSMSRAASRQKLGLESDDFVAIVIAAQLESPLKQVEKFLDMFEKVSRHSKMRRRVLLVGSGGSRFAAQYSNTIWLGELAPEAVAETIAAADFVASSSLSESAGLTVREAGAVGVPALVLRNGGSDELVKDGESGYLFQTLEDMSLRIESLLADPSPLIGLGKSANQLARGHAHPEMVAKKFLELYRLGN